VRQQRLPGPQIREATGGIVVTGIGPGGKVLDLAMVGQHIDQRASGVTIAGSGASSQLANATLLS